MEMDGPVRVSTPCPAAGDRNAGLGRLGRGAVITLLFVVGVLSALVAGCAASHPGAPSPAAHHAAPVLPPPVAVISTDPPDRATDISPLKPIAVTVTKGKLTQVSLTNTQGAPVVGQIDADGKSWKTTKPLGYSRVYTITANAVGDD